MFTLRSAELLLAKAKYVLIASSRTDVEPLSATSGLTCSLNRFCQNFICECSQLHAHRASAKTNKNKNNLRNIQSGCTGPSQRKKYAYFNALTLCLSFGFSCFLISIKNKTVRVFVMFHCVRDLVHNSDSKTNLRYCYQLCMTYFLYYP